VLIIFDFYNNTHEQLIIPRHLMKIQEISFNFLYNLQVKHEIRQGVTYIILLKTSNNGKINSKLNSN